MPDADLRAGPLSVTPKAASQKTAVPLGKTKTILYRLYIVGNNVPTSEAAHKGVNDAIGCHVCGVNGHLRAQSFEGKKPYATIRYVDLSARAPASSRKLAQIERRSGK